MKTVLVALFAVASCTGKQHEEAPRTPPTPVETKKVEPPPTPTPPTTGGVLQLAAAKMIATPGGVLSIDANGKVTLEGKDVGTVNATGTFTRGGDELATIDADGNVELKGWGPGEQLSLRADGALLDHGKVSLAPQADGTLAGPLADTELKGAKLVLAGDKVGFRALMFAWLAVSKT